MPGWRDLLLEPITSDRSGGGYVTPDYFQRSNTRRRMFPGTDDPIANMQIEKPQIQEAPITSITQPWKPSRNRHTMEAFETPAMTDYMKHITNIPQREEYSPSIWHRIVGGLAGGVEGGTRGAAAGVKTATEVLDLPYRRALEQYQIKGEGLEAAAKIEEAGNRNRVAYQKAILDQEEADKDREVKWANSEINRIKAEQAGRRISIDEEIRRATNQVAVDRLIAQKNKWDQDYQTELDKLEILKQNAGTARFNAESTRMNVGINQQNANTASRRADSYQQYMGQLGNRPIPQAQIAAAREMAEAEVRNAHMAAREYPQRPGVRGGAASEPSWFNEQGLIKPEFAEQFEREVQERIARKIRAYGNVNLGAMGNFDPSNAPDDSPYEIIP